MGRHHHYHQCTGTCINRIYVNVYQIVILRVPVRSIESRQFTAKPYRNVALVLTHSTDYDVKGGKSSPPPPTKKPWLRDDAILAGRLIQRYSSPKNKAQLEGAPFFAHRRTKSWRLVIILAKILFLAPQESAAQPRTRDHHNSTPVGSNLTINRFASIELREQRLYLHPLNSLD